MAAMFLGAVSSLSAAPSHQVNPAKTIMVSVTGSKVHNARAGGVLSSSTLKASSLSVDFQCRSTESLGRGKISTAAGSTGWKKANAKSKSRGSGSSPRSGAITFANVPLVKVGAMRAMCPKGKKESVFQEATLELTAECVGRKGKKRVVSSQFPQMLRLDCDQLEANSIAEGNTFWHTCPKGYVLKSNPRKNKIASKDGWGKPKTCVKKK